MTSENGDLQFEYDRSVVGVEVGSEKVPCGVGRGVLDVQPAIRLIHDGRIHVEASLAVAHADHRVAARGDRLRLQRRGVARDARSHLDSDDRAQVILERNLVDDEESIAVWNDHDQPAIAGAVEGHEPIASDPGNEPR